MSEHGPSVLTAIRFAIADAMFDAAPRIAEATRPLTSWLNARAWRLRRLAGRVRGCGCDHEDPDVCGQGEWCECPHHEANRGVS